MLRLIHNLACKVRLVRVVAPCSADRTLAHQVSRLHFAGASAVWHHTLDRSSLRTSLSRPLLHGANPTTTLSHIKRSFSPVYQDNWRAAKTLPRTTGLFAGTKLIARLFHGKAKSFAVNFPDLPSWQTVASSSSTQKSASIFARIIAVSDP